MVSCWAFFPPRPDPFLYTYRHLAEAVHGDDSYDDSFDAYVETKEEEKGVSVFYMSILDLSPEVEGALKSVFKYYCQQAPSSHALDNVKFFKCMADHDIVDNKKFMKVDVDLTFKKVSLLIRTVSRQ